MRKSRISWTLAVLLLSACATALPLGNPRAAAPQTGADYHVLAASPSTTVRSPSPSVSAPASPLSEPSPLSPLNSPSPISSPVVVPVGNTPNPGPQAARGQCLLNGVGVAGIAIQLINRAGGGVKLTTDAQGYFTAKGLTPGDYYAHYYNATDRNKIGYWNSVSQHVDALHGAAYPPVDLYQKGMTNTPPMNAHIGLPMTFVWVPQTQPVVYYRFRVHTRPYTAFQLFYQSDKIDGGATAYTWDGHGMRLPLDPANRYFWGVQWDAGPIGQGGNLYQAAYFDPPAVYSEQSSPAGRRTPARIVP